MSKLCPKCGKVLEDNITQCPECGTAVENEKKEENNINDIIETPSLEENSLDDTTVLKVPGLDEIGGELESNDIEEKVETSVPVEVVEEPKEEVVEDVTQNTEEIKEEKVETPASVEIVEEPKEEVVEDATQNTEEIKEEKVETQVPVEVVEQPKEEVVEDATQNTEEIKEEKVETPVPVEVVEEPKEEVVEDATQNTEEIKEEKVEPPTAIEKSDTILPDENVLQETSVDDITNPIVDNSNLETVSTDASNLKLEEEEKEIPIPTLPDAAIGEINPDILGNAYEAEEKANNEKIEAKKRLEEEEKKRREEEELARIANMEKPDLLAAATNNAPTSDESSSEKPKKKKNNKIILIVIAVIAVIAVGVAVWYFVFGGNKEKSNYMDPINAYFEGYSNNEAEKMLSAFAPCASSSENIVDMVSNTLNARSDYNEIEVTLTVDRTEVVNSSDRENLVDTKLEFYCGTTPEIQEYMQVYVVEHLVVEKEEEYDTYPKFWLVKIDDIWYIAFIDEASWK